MTAWRKPPLIRLRFLFSAVKSEPPPCAPELLQPQSAQGDIKGLPHPAVVRFRTVHDLCGHPYLFHENVPAVHLTIGVPSLGFLKQDMDTPKALFGCSHALTESTASVSGLPASPTPVEVETLQISLQVSQVLILKYPSVSTPGPGVRLTAAGGGVWAPPRSGSEGSVASRPPRVRFRRAVLVRPEQIPRPLRTRQSLQEVDAFF